MEPSDEELLGLMPQQLRDDLAAVSRMAAHGAGPDVTPGLFEASLTAGALQFVRVVLAAEDEGPAVPEGREPASVVGEPSDEELLELWQGWNLGWDPQKGTVLMPHPAEYARAVLARYGHQPAPPTEGEVADLIAWLGDEADQYDCIQQAAETSHKLRRAADLLEQRHPEPVPVSERLPEPGDCDAEGLCWVWHTTAYTWGLFRLDLTAHSHWLPATALPLPVTVLALLSLTSKPAEEEVANEAKYLAKELRDQADDLSPSLELFGLMHNAADLLEQRYHRPVPVSERLPEPSTKVLAHYFNDHGKGRTICAIWVPAKSRSDDFDGSDDFTEYDEKDDTFYWPEGWYEAIENWDDFGWIKVYQGEVIYWRPLPAWPALPLPAAEVRP